MEVIDLIEQLRLRQRLVVLERYLAQRDKPRPDKPMEKPRPDKPMPVMQATIIQLAAARKVLA
jgi:hypothetical protein